MKIHFSIIMNKDILIKQDGVALVIALLMLLILTLIGISSITTTTFESSISGNERVKTDAFYAAEAGIQVGLNQLPDNTQAIAKTKLKEDSLLLERTSAGRGNPQEPSKSGCPP